METASVVGQAFWLLFKQTWWWVVPILGGLYVYHRKTAVPDDPPPTPEPVLLPDLSPEWKVVRNLTDAIYTAIDNAIEALADDGLIEDTDEEAISELADRLGDYAMYGKRVQV